MSIIFFYSELFLRETMLFCPLFYDRKRASLFPTVTPSDRLFPSSTTNDKVTFPFPKKTEAEKTEKKLWQHNYCLLMRFAAAGLSPQQKGYSSRQLFQPFVTDILFFSGSQLSSDLLPSFPFTPSALKLGLLLSAGFKAFPRFCFGWALYISPFLVVGKEGNSQPFYGENYMRRLFLSIFIYENFHTFFGKCLSAHA